MWRQIFRPHVTRDDRDRFVIAPHHPDRLRRPLVSLGAASDERFQQALVWNIFRTLELVAPSFWLRRFHIRLTGEASLVPPQISRVHLWQALPLPPIQRIDGARPDLIADVVIETEHSVWTLVAANARDGAIDSEQAAAVVDAGTWFAGARHHYYGVLESTATSPRQGAVLQTRYSRSRDSARLQSATRGPSAPSHVQWGAIGWSELTALLEDCCGAAALQPVERALAQNAVDWLTTAGVSSLPMPPAREAVSG